MAILFGKWLFHHHCMILSLWTGAESCWNFHFWVAKVLLGPEKYNGHQIITVHFLVHFNSLFLENQGCFVSTNSTPIWRTENFGGVRLLWMNDPETSDDQILLFWQLCDCSIVNSFLSVKTIFPIGYLWCNVRVQSIFAVADVFSFSVSSWSFWSL